ncbi:hypothetical protein J2S74_000446 [Evansella vedderi]|uniref:Peptidase M28 domain-containing protein n=1 Tax=Evansella vedderi TaxID=38282 RepID=A0ABT9ZQE7_9BACI|nr:M28 family peptidase [Evansella vedderi]MDQ0253074.1 hypothetical protein [Evansella vedderi]
MKQEFITFIEKLSDPALNGRVPGTEGHNEARRMITEQVETLGLDPLLKTGWVQSYLAHDGVTGRNLLAVNKGSKEDWMLLGAHYDHLRGCPGADDNAAAVGILLAVMDALRNLDLQMNIVLAIFDMEEPPYFQTESMGSVHFYRHLPEGLNWDTFRGAVILDLCGHDLVVKNRENSLFIVGAETCPKLSESVSKARGMVEDLEIYKVRNRDFLYLSDHYIFDINGKPNLFLSCGHWPYYHTPEDTFEKINLDKVGRIADFIRMMIMELDKGEEEPGYLPSFKKEDEAKELGRFLNTELNAEHHLDAICGILMREMRNETDIEKMKKSLQQFGLI